MSAIRYARAPSAALHGLLKDGLLAPLLRPWVAKNLPLDLQLREKDTVSLYCGLTSVLNARLTRRGVRCSARDTYTDQACARPLMRDWKLEELGFEDALAGYLAAVRIADRWTETEGSVQAAWMQRCAPLVPLDREAVIGGGSFGHPRVGVAGAALRSHARPQGWAQQKDRRSANEVDVLGLDSAGRLVLVELKHGAAKSDTIYYAPFQALRYAWEWADRVERLLPEIEALVRAKQRLGLLPPELPRLRPELRVLVAWGLARPSPEVVWRTQQVRDLMEAHLPPGIATIELWDESDRPL